MKVVVTDQDPASCDRMLRLMQGWGYQGEVAADREAIWRTLLEDEEPMIAIIDCSGPGLDGLDVFRDIRATIKNGKVYLVLLSTRCDQRFAGEALEAGADGYLPYPVAEADLRICLENGRRLLELEAALALKSTRDALTGLYNRAAIVEHLEKELARCQRDRSALSVVLADLDGLQQINERNGHLVGDAVLQQVCGRLHDALRPYDHLGRYGDDELLMILPTCNTAGALEVAERARMAVAVHPVETEAGAILTSISSVAATVSGNRRIPAATLLQFAETAIYRAKEKGRNQVVLANKYCSLL